MNASLATAAHAPAVATMSELKKIQYQLQLDDVRISHFRPNTALQPHMSRNTLHALALRVNNILS